MSDSFGVESPVVGVVSGLDAAVGDLVGLDLTALSDEDCVRLVERIEIVSRRLSAAGLPVLREVSVRRAFSKAGCSSPAALLTSVVRLRPGAARARVAAMDALTSSVTPSGETIEPRFAQTAELLRGGVIDLDHAGVVMGVMAKIPHKVDPETRENTEAALAQLCRTYTPGKVETIGDRIVEYLDPDGTLADDTDRARTRGFTVGKQASDLMSKVAGHLDPTTRALLDVLLGVWAAAGMNNPDDPFSPSGAADDPALDKGIVQAAANNDLRSQAQRNHDALKAMLVYLIESGQLGASHRGVPVQVIISMTKDQVDEAIREQTGGVTTEADTEADTDTDTDTDTEAAGDTATEDDADADADADAVDDAATDEAGVAVGGADDAGDDAAATDAVDIAPEQLIGQTQWEDPDWLPAGGPPARRPYGSGVVYTASGAIVPIGDAMRLAVRCDKSLVVFDNHSHVPLYFGRARRLASEAQRLTMFAAHRGCSHPGCSNPALWAEAHHVREWAQGGFTDITHLAPACPQHHKLIGPGEHQWQTIMVTEGPDAGRCAWIAPAILDPERKPRVNRAHHPDEALTEARLAMQARRTEQLAERKRQLGIEPPAPPVPSQSPDATETSSDTVCPEEPD